MIRHIRLGNTSLEYLKQLQKSEEKLVKIKYDKEIRDCEVRILAKMENLPFREKRPRPNRTLHTIHADTMGPKNRYRFPEKIN